MASVAMIVLFFGHVTAEVVHAEGNPHTHGATAPACCPVQSLDPATLYSGALLLSRQADTFDRVRTRKHLGTPIHIFSFRQPRRLRCRHPHHMPSFPKATRLTSSFRKVAKAVPKSWWTQVTAEN